jgi:hypothetical protein
MTMQSKAILVGKLDFPQPSNTRIQMMPINIHSLDGGDLLLPWKSTVQALIRQFPLSTLDDETGDIGYITIDERVMNADQRQRRSGLHVDGWAAEGSNVTAHGGGGGGAVWASKYGMFLANNMDDTCRVYVGNLPGIPAYDGCCEHMRDLLHTMQTIDMKAGEIWWMNSLALHETVPQANAGVRQFIRMSMPNKGQWYSDYTENPTGLKAPGEIVGARMHLKENLPEWK